MSDLTKQALVESFKSQLRSKPYDKITVSDITDEQGLSRQTFYYHFDNVFGMIEWVYASGVREELREGGPSLPWRDMVASVLRRTLEERELIEGAYRSKARDDLLGLYAKYSRLHVGRAVAEREGDAMEPEDRDFVTTVYSCAFVGVMRRWIEGGMREDPDAVADRMATFVRSSFDRTLMAFRGPGTARAAGTKP